MKTSYIKAYNQDISVEVHELHNKVPAFKVRALYGETVVELSGTLSTVDGKEMPDQDHVQKAVDELRVRAAHQAVVREELRRQLEGVK